MVKRYSILAAILLLVFGGTFAWVGIRAYFTKQFIAHYQPPAVAVSTVKAKAVSWSPKLTAVGTLRSVNGVEINSEVAGQVMHVFFHSGGFVKKGDPLLQLDDVVDQETLKNHKAQLDFNKLMYRRQMKLYQNNATAKSIVDNAHAKLLQSEAAVKTAEVMIEKKNIKAPFSGKLGIRAVNVGQFVSPGQALVPLQSLDPLFVDFALPEQDLRRLYVGQPIQIKTDAFPNHPFSGSITAVSSLVDESTRSIRVRATVPNPKKQLYPGLYADVRVLLPQKHAVITVPQTAITYSLYGDSVFIVQSYKDKKTGKHSYKVVQKFVTLGPRKGAVIAIQKGLNVGEQVVTSGQLKLHNGSRVIVNNSIHLS